MSTIKADAVTAVSTNGDLSLDGLGTGGVSIASTLKMAKGGDIASASPLVIDTDGNYFDVTGTTNFAAMTVEAGNFFMLQFDGALTITHGSGIEIPGAANLTTAAGDRLMCYATAANTVEVMSVETEAAASSGGAWTFIAKTTASDSASITVSGLSSTYDLYAVSLDDLQPANDAVGLSMRFGDSGGLDTGGSDYHWQHLLAADPEVDTIDDSAGEIAINPVGVNRNMGSASGEGEMGMFFLQCPHGATSTYPAIQGQYTGHGQTNNPALYTTGGGRNAVMDLTQIQIYFSSGNIANGTLSVWGIKQS
jgi:hypothetical protein